MSDKHIWMPSLPLQALDGEGGSSEHRHPDSEVGHWRHHGRVSLATRYTTKLLDDDEWIRSLTELQSITADFPKGK